MKSVSANGGLNRSAGEDEIERKVFDPEGGRPGLFGRRSSDRRGLRTVRNQLLSGLRRTELELHRGERPRPLQLSVTRSIVRELWEIWPASWDSG